MKAFPAFLALVVLLPGCVDADPVEPPGNDGMPTPEPLRVTYFWKAAYGMAPEAPAKSTPDRVAANPMVNGFANEDLRAFTSAPTPSAMNLTRVHLVAYYEVAAPTADPFPVTSNPQQARQIVFWIGSRGIYPASVSTIGDTALLPGRVYRAEADIPLPEPGWVVPAGEPLQILVATLAFNDRGAEMRFLVDSTETPSRIELEGNTTSDAVVPPDVSTERKDLEIAGNAGMFTGATADRVPSKIRQPIVVRPNDTYLEVRVLFRGNAGGKSDLDFDLFAPNGQVAAVSSTPFQSETLRLFAPNLAFHGPGTYQAEVVAYSGVNTRFTMETVRGGHD